MGLTPRASRSEMDGNAVQVVDPAGEAVLSLSGLTKRYGDRLAVDELDLAVPRGAIFGFLGPNGAGKTTTIRMCLGLIAPTAGRAAILGHDVARDGARILRRVGALVEQPALYLHLSGRNNLRAVGGALGGVPAAQIDAVLEMVGLRGRERDRVKTYSLGMKQRLGVALALLHDPEMLILDEPANGLDPAGVVEMRDLLRRLAAEGKTIFLSSHVLAEVRHLCTRVAIISRGRLVTESDVAELVGGNGVFAVRLDRPAEALALLQAQPWGRAARLAFANRQDEIITPAPEGQSGALNLFLVRAGFVPGAITPYEEDLEAIFLRLTGASQGAPPSDVADVAGQSEHDHHGHAEQSMKGAQ